MYRLVAATWHRAGAKPAGTGSSRWLVELDGSACALHAAAMAVRLAALEPNAEADLVYVEPWLSKESAETELTLGSWAATAPAHRLLEAAALHFAPACPHGRRSDRNRGPGRALDSQGLTAAESLLRDAMAYKILHLARVPPLVVRP